MNELEKRLQDLYSLIKKVYKFENYFDLPTIEIHTKLINGKIFYYLFVTKDNERETDEITFYSHSENLDELFALNMKYFKQFLTQ